MTQTRLSALTVVLVRPLQEKGTAFQIRDAAERALPSSLRKIQIEGTFKKSYVREVCREADGYQPHLVSPEKGIRRLVAEAIKLVEQPVQQFVDAVHLLLLDTIR